MIHHDVTLLPYRPEHRLTLQKEKLKCTRNHGHFSHRLTQVGGRKEKERQSIIHSQYHKRSSGNDHCKSGWREARNVQNDYQRRICEVYLAVACHFNIDVRTDVNITKF